MINIDQIYKNKIANITKRKKEFLERKARIRQNYNEEQVNRDESINLIAKSFPTPNVSTALKPHLNLLKKFAGKYIMLDANEDIDDDFVRALVRNDVLEKDVVNISYNVKDEYVIKLVELLSAKGIDISISDLKLILVSLKIELVGNEYKKVFGKTKNYNKILDKYLIYYGYSSQSRERFMTFVNYLKKIKVIPKSKDISDLCESTKRIANDLNKKTREKELYQFEENILCNDIRLSIEDIDRLDGKGFEVTLGKLFKKQGYKTINTVYSNDQGADLILEKFGKKIVIQAKRYSGKVPNKAIQEVVAAKNHYSCDEAWIVTNSTLTKPAIELAKSNKVIIVDREKLKKMI